MDLFFYFNYEFFYFKHVANVNITPIFLYTNGMYHKNKYINVKFKNILVD